jgi:hypothetical protein
MRDARATGPRSEINIFTKRKTRDLNCRLCQLVPLRLSAIARSIEAFGFNAPILVDKNNKIVAGHGRYEAAKLLGLDKVPIVSLSHLTETQARAYLLADNKLTDRSTWDDNKLAIQLKELSDLVLDFDIEAIGFEPPEIDLRIQSLDSALEEADDQFELATGPVVSRTGDLWLLGSHRLYCGSALDATSYDALSNGEKAAAAITDPPYNCKIDGHVSGNGRTTHREFAMASGEMSEAEFTDFLWHDVRILALLGRALVEEIAVGSPGGARRLGAALRDPADAGGIAL